MDEIPSVTIGGRAFAVPRLVIKQLKVVVPGIFKLQKILPKPGEDVSLDDETFGLLLDVVFVGISAGSPGFTRQNFEELPASPAELLDALGVISGQTGMEKVRPAAAEAAGNGTGEAKAAA
jgi:hypothetical protein